MTMKAKPKLNDLNAHLVCSLCKGYLIDASTLSDCPHSFCRSCLLRHLSKERRCPTCRIEVKLHDTTAPFHSDNALQDLVYKLLPSVYKDELKRRGDFYRQFCERKKKADGSAGRVQIFDKHLVELAAFICTPDENISLAIEYVTHPVHIDRGASETQQSKTLKRKRPSKDKNDKILTFKRFFRCPAAVTVGTLKKLLRYKLELTGSFEIELLQKTNEPLEDSMSLMDIAYIYSWRRKAPMQLYFTLYKADVLEEDEAPELEQMPQLTREASPLKSEPPPSLDAEEAPSKGPNVPTFSVTLNSLNTKLFDMSQTQSAHPPIITTSTTVSSATSSSSTPVAARRQKRKPSSPSKKTKNPSPSTESQPTACNGPLPSNGVVRPDSKNGSKLSSESTSSTPSPVPPMQRMTGAPPTAKAPVSPAMMKAALETAKWTCYNFTGQPPHEIKKQKMSPLAAKPAVAATTAPTTATQSNGSSARTTERKPTPSDQVKNATLKSMLNRPPPSMTAADSLSMSKNGGLVSSTCCSSTPVTFTSPTSLPPSVLSIGHDNLTLPLPNGPVALPSSRTSAPPLTVFSTNNNIYTSTSSATAPPSVPPPLLNVSKPMVAQMPVVTTTFGLVVVSDPTLFRSTNTASSSTSAVPLVSR